MRAKPPSARSVRTDFSCRCRSQKISSASKTPSFAEPVPTTIAGAEGVIELRRLTPEEKAARRFRRNAIMLLTGVSILMMIVLLLGTKKK